MSVNNITSSSRRRDNHLQQEQYSFDPPSHPVIDRHQHRHQQQKCNRHPDPDLHSRCLNHRVILCSSFQQHLANMSTACGQQTCAPVITNFTPPPSQATQVMIASDWDDPLSHFYEDKKTKQQNGHVIPLTVKKMPVTNGCKSFAFLNGHHKSYITAPAAAALTEKPLILSKPVTLPLTSAGKVENTTSSPDAADPASSYRVLTWNGQWVQCSGHSGVFAPSKEGTIWKKTSVSSSCSTKSAANSSAAGSHSEENNEIEAYKKLMRESEMREFVPRFYSEIQLQGDRFIEIEDLLRHFRPSDSSTPASTSSPTTTTAPTHNNESTSKTKTTSSPIRLCAQTALPPSSSSTTNSTIISSDRNTPAAAAAAPDSDHKEAGSKQKLYIMDIKMGTRTFLEQEASSPTERADLYEKMVKVDPTEPTDAEHDSKSVTKLRYMRFRESLSSTSSQGFRIEGIQPFPAKEQIGKDFHKIRDEEEICRVLSYFLHNNDGSNCDISGHTHSRDRERTSLSGTGSLKQQFVRRLYELRRAFMNSEFFSTHEVIGSSLLVIHDGIKLGVWMIDFAKSVPLPAGTSVDHMSAWTLGNHEDGYLFGLNNLIRLLDGL